MFGSGSGTTDARASATVSSSGRRTSTTMTTVATNGSIAALRMLARSRTSVTVESIAPSVAGAKGGG